MPLYEYRCETCSMAFEELVSSTSPAPVHCPNCASTSVNRQMSVFAAHATPAAPSCRSDCAQPSCPAMGPRPTGGCCGGACSH